MIRLLTFILVLFLWSTGCGGEKEPAFQEPRSLSRKTANYDGVLAHDWVQLAYQFIKDNNSHGPHAARAYGYIGFTIWEAVYGGIPKAKNMTGQVNDYFEAEDIDLDREYDWGIVLSAAMKVVVPEVIEKITPSQRTAVGLLADLQENQLVAKGVKDNVRLPSKELGRRIGMRIVYRVKRDGRDNIKNVNPVLPARTTNTQWYWDSKTLNQTPVEPMWGTLRTFVVKNTQVCEGEPPYVYSTSPSSNFYKDAKEVADFSKNNTNKAIAYHWENGPGRTCSAACHWISIAEQLLKAKGSNLAESAKTYCLLGFIASDVYGHCWYMKYKYNLLRPITYIREQISPGWNSIVTTPPFPDYISASATMGGAAPDALTDILGNISFIDRTHLGSALYTPDGGPFVLPERTFSSLAAAGEEQALSRMIGGVHFRKACETGLETGKCIGKTIRESITFE